MTPPRLRYQTLEFGNGNVDIHIRTLRDTLEIADDGDLAESLGVPEASWALFGVLWASGEALARLMFEYDIEGKRILEIGCGIGLASLVLNHRHADITATDRHPQAETFLKANVKLNAGRDIPFWRAGWSEDDAGLGKFDLIIGSDILYARDQCTGLATFIDQHARLSCDVLIIDPGRGQRGYFSKQMLELGFSHDREKADLGVDVDAPFRGTVLSYARTARRTS